MLLVYLSLAWVAGIFLGSLFKLPAGMAFAGLVPLPILFFKRGHRRLICVTSACLFLILGGAAYYQTRLPLASEATLADPWMPQLRDELAKVLAKLLPEPQAALAQGVLLGIRGSIPAWLIDDFNRTGTTHILAISGQNLSIVAGMLVSLGVWLLGRRRRLYVWPAMATVWLYSLLTGMQPPVVRGALMASVFLLADVLGRQRTAFVALAFAAAVMVGADPEVLWNISFQLSVLAIAGLVFIFPRLQSLGRGAVAARLGDEGALVSAANFAIDGLGVSVAAVAAVWPLIAHYFGVISWVGPVATLFAVPVLPGIIVAGALAGLVGLVALPVAQVIAWIAWLFLSYLVLVVRMFSGVPVIQGARIDGAPIVVYYSILVLILWLTSRKERVVKLRDFVKSVPDKFSAVAGKVPMKLAVPALGIGAALVWIAVATLPNGDLHASFLDVGQGDATLFQQGSRQVLVDGGPTGEAISLALGREMPFWDRTIELVVLTHPHADHMDGLLEVLKRYRVERVLYADFDSTSPLHDEWLKSTEKWRQVILERNIRYDMACAGQLVSLGPGLRMEVLNPPSDFLSGTESDIDNNAAVVRIEYGDVSFLVTGDIMWEAENEFVTGRSDIGSTVLKIGHHGSSTSTTQAFLEVVNPRLAVISVGKDNPFGHPTKEVLGRLEAKLGAGNMFRTDLDGTIDMTTDGKKLWVETQK